MSALIGKWDLLWLVIKKIGDILIGTFEGYSFQKYLAMFPPISHFFAQWANYYLHVIISGWERVV
jgi:hypothetical protein